MRSLPALCSFLVVASGLAAQGTYTPYGNGCSGSGTGLGTKYVTPATYANRFAGSDNVIPFSGQVTKYQQVILGAELPNAFTMAGLGARRDERWAGIERVLVDLEIQIGYTTRTPATLSTTFAANWDAGAPATVLPRGLFLYPAMPKTPLTDPAEFVLRIPWQATFDWVPMAGRNLLVQVIQRGGSRPFAYPLDAGGSPSIARLYAFSDTALTGSSDVPNYGLVLCFYELTHTAVPILSSKETPQIGNQMPVQLAEARASAQAVLLLGASDRTWTGLMLPFDLTPFGGIGCSVLASGELQSRVTTNAAGTAKFVYDIPLAITLIGVRFHNQYVIVDPGANTLGLAVSNAATGVIGF